MVGVPIALPSPEAGFSEGGGRQALTNSGIYAVKMQLRLLAQRCNRLTPLLAAPAALLLSQGQAKAFLTYNIFESAGNVVVQTSGSLDLTGATQSSNTGCGFDGAIGSAFAGLCTGPNNNSTQTYVISGPATFDGTVFKLGASSVSGISTFGSVPLRGVKPEARMP